MNEADWVSYEEALAVILAAVERTGVETLAAEDALARALAEPIVAPVDHPPWDNSAMDGFAVHADDVRGASVEAPVSLPISETVSAGAFPSEPLRRGTAVRVMTGAPVPEGASGVVRVEHTDAGPGDRVTIYDDADASRHIRPRAEDVRRGDVLLSPGEEITPAVIGMLAMAGAGEVRVGRRPRVGILCNGDELAEPGDFDQVAAGRRIANSNGPALAAQVRRAGGEPVSLGIARDDPASLEHRLVAGARCDAIVSAAGVSVGEHDYVKVVLERLGFARRFWRVRMRPGSATLFGLLDGRPVWGVPGNPVSAMVTFETLVRPAIRRMAGFAAVERTEIPCRVAHDIHGSADVVSFLRVVLTDGGGDPLEVRLSGPQGSGLLTSMLADGLLVFPEHKSRLDRGERARVLPLHDWSRAP